MTTPISESTVERFREAAAGGQPAPAGVAVAAVSAGFALGLLAKALAVSARRGGPAADLARPLLDTLRAESGRMLQLAADDTAAFEAYLACARLPHATERERIERRSALDAALGKAIDLPLAAAAAAAAGLQCSAEALALVDLVVLADLGAAVALLSGALRAFLLCAESNVGVLGPGMSAYRERLAEATGRHRSALQLAEEVLGSVAGRLSTASPGSEA